MDQSPESLVYELLYPALRFVHMRALICSAECYDNSLLDLDTARVCSEKCRENVDLMMKENSEILQPMGDEFDKCIFDVQQMTKFKDAKELLADDSTRKCMHNLTARIKKEYTERQINNYFIGRYGNISNSFQ
mmetsp:Transcript_57119/g.65132  ORF Transcript_57119/g.65132 Transcript_57119/m.65132 type:complete len:133 (-) Transcript_57119:106-504(-)